MTRKILYSPGYGAGWVSWHGGSSEHQRFMLEYAPFVEAIERGESITPMIEPLADDGDPYEGQTDPLIRRFIDDWRAKFGGASLPYFGGLRDLAVESVDDGDVVRINEYDGNESVEIRGAWDSMHFPDMVSIDADVCERCAAEWFATFKRNPLRGEDEVTK